MSTRPATRALRLPVPAGAAVIACVLLLSACGSSETLNPTPLPTPDPTLTATPEVGFVINVTAVPTLRPHRVHPTPTPFTPPADPYIVLSRASGPPAQREIVVRGGHLPPSSPVSLEWSLNGKSSPIATTVYTDKHGRLRAGFTIPASPPGTYRVLASIGGAVWARAVYRVRSAATLSGTVTPVAQGERVTIKGRHFLPQVKLLLVAYPLSARGKPIVLGSIHSGSDGSFTYTRTVSKLAMGQYVVRAWSQNAFAAEMAEAFIQVVI